MNYEEPNTPLSPYHQLIKGCFRIVLLKYFMSCLVLYSSVYEFITKNGAKKTIFRVLRFFLSLFAPIKIMKKIKWEIFSLISETVVCHMLHISQIVGFFLSVTFLDVRGLNMTLRGPCPLSKYMYIVYTCNVTRLKYIHLGGSDI